MRRERIRDLAGLVVLVLLVAGAAEWWREHQAGRLGERLAAAARPGDIELISSTTCVFCERARRWMTLHRVPFGECFIERDTACAARYQALGAPGTPVVLVRGAPQLGFSPPAVLARLAGAPAAGG